MDDSINKMALVIELQNRGYGMDYIVSDTGIVCIQKGDTFTPGEFEIAEAHHFNAQSTIYAINLIDTDQKGILNTYPLTKDSLCLSTQLRDKLFNSPLNI